VRALQDHGERKPSRLTRRPALASVANGTGGFVTLYGGQLTTHRAFADGVPETLHDLGATNGGLRSKDVPLYCGGAALRARLALGFSRSSRKARQPTPERRAIAGPSPMATRSRGSMKRCCSSLASRGRSPPG